jgi:hypothetical protein
MIVLEVRLLTIGVCILLRDSKQSMLNDTIPFLLIFRLVIKIANRRQSLKWWDASDLVALFHTLVQYHAAVMSIIVNTSLTPRDSLIDRRTGYTIYAFNGTIHDSKAAVIVQRLGVLNDFVHRGGTALQSLGAFGGDDFHGGISDCGRWRPSLAVGMAGKSLVVCDSERYGAVGAWTLAFEPVARAQ